jgi:N-acetylglutamate synthase-like GNAT family acetyltransferase
MLTGVGSTLMEAVSSALEELRVRRAVLATADAHALHARCGFEPMAEPERWMLRSFQP